MSPQQHPEGAAAADVTDASASAAAASAKDAGAMAACALPPSLEGLERAAVVKTSRLSGFHRLGREERLRTVAEAAGLSEQEVASLSESAKADGDVAEHLCENCVSTMNVPLGVATNLIVDGVDVLVPMATEEASVVAAVCNGAKACRASGGVRTASDEPRMMAQIQILDLDGEEAVEAAAEALRSHECDVIAFCDKVDPLLKKFGGGCRGLETHVVGGADTGFPRMLVLHLIVDVRDAMGANAVNTMAERLTPDIERWTGGRIGLRILTNLAEKRITTATAVWKASELGGEGVVDNILAAYAFAACDPYRAATHNKGIMNGISAVALATGNDTRALEAGAHAYAGTRNGGVGYHPLTKYRKTEAGDLEGSISLPTALGIVGGATRAHPTARIALKIMGGTLETGGCDRLARVIASVGLVQNFSAMRALATTGIQAGHMRLHARNQAVSAGAKGAEIDAVAAELIKRGTVNEGAARGVLAEMAAKGKE